MSIVVQHKNINYRVFDKELYNISLNEWKNYKITESLNNKSCTLITFNNDYTISLYPLSDKRWLVSMKQTVKNVNESNDENIIIREGNRCGECEGTIAFLWSLLNNFSTRNAAEFNEREHDLYRQIGNFFYFNKKKWESVIDNWKANAKISAE